MSLFARVHKLWVDGGPTGLLRGFGRLIESCAHHLFLRREYLLHEFDLSSVDDRYSAPPVGGLDVHIVECDEDADRLVELGFDDFRAFVPDATHRVECGAVAFCAYVQGILAHVAWIALTQRAKDSFDNLDYEVRFGEREGCSGGSWTYPSFRCRGLYRHVMWHRLKYLSRKGCLVCRDATERHNLASIQGQGVFGPRTYGLIRITRLLWITRSQLTLFALSEDG